MQRPANIRRRLSISSSLISKIQNYGFVPVHCNPLFIQGTKLSKIDDSAMFYRVMLVPDAFFSVLTYPIMNLF